MSKKNKKKSLNKQSLIALIITIAILLSTYVIAVFTDIEFPFHFPFEEDILSFINSIGLENIPIHSEGYSNVNNGSSSFEVHVIDVDQGSSTFFTSNGYNLLIDTGENGNGEKIVRYIKRLGFDEIDMLIVTHPHSDHIGSADEILELMNIENIIMPELPKSVIPTTKSYINVLETIDKQSKRIIPAKVGDSYQLGDMFVEIFGPNPIIDSNLNNYSVITKITGGNTSVLVTGDAEEEAENPLLKYKERLSSEILIVGHHGSKTSSSEKFLEMVNPQFSIISAGNNNSYGHPHAIILYRLENINSALYRTDLNGTIILKVENNIIDVECEN